MRVACLLFLVLIFCAGCDTASRDAGLSGDDDSLLQISDDSSNSSGMIGWLLKYDTGRNDSHRNPDKVVQLTDALRIPNDSQDFIKAHGRIIITGPFGQNCLVLVRDSSLQAMDFGTLALKSLSAWDSAKGSFMLLILGCDSASVWALELSYDDGTGYKYATLCCFSHNKATRIDVPYGSEDQEQFGRKEIKSMAENFGSIAEKGGLDRLSSKNMSVIYASDYEDGIAAVVSTPWKQNVCWMMGQGTQMCWSNNDWQVKASSVIPK